MVETAATALVEVLKFGKCLILRYEKMGGCQWSQVLGRVEA